MEIIKGAGSVLSSTTVQCALSVVEHGRILAIEKIRLEGKVQLRDHKKDFIFIFIFNFDDKMKIFEQFEFRTK